MSIFSKDQIKEMVQHYDIKTTKDIKNHLKYSATLKEKLDVAYYKAGLQNKLLAIIEQQGKLLFVIKLFIAGLEKSI